MCIVTIFTSHNNSFTYMYCSNILYCFIFISLQDGHTALIDAATKGYTSIVKILLDRGAATDIRNKVTDILLYTSHKPVQKEIVWKLLNTY